MDSSFKTSSIGEGVIGRGLDSIDRDWQPSIDNKMSLRRDLLVHGWPLHTSPPLNNRLQHC
jgi:hypothetical protein